ncbi:hypothetical protein TNCT_691231 [Trichonephila clavata]|uniref:Uncharacterized protein n=1 Tax=Trichonephila clavata TaxID=2740835 RepID=A0A8X6F0P0_TRICU|nr:hypothetical protein TNCT_691231 [Trichonephila clavata]
MRGKRPGNLDYPKIELPEKVAESPRKKEVEVFSQFGQTVEMLKKQLLPGKMEIEQNFLIIRSKTPPLKIKSKSLDPEIKRKALALEVKRKALTLEVKRKALALEVKRKALALEVKRKALALKINMSLALKIKRKVLALKIKGKIPPGTLKKAISPQAMSEICKKITEDFPETEMRGKRLGNLDNRVGKSRK